MDEELSFPPPEGVGYVRVSGDAAELGAWIAAHNGVARIGVFLGDPSDEVIQARALLMGQEMFRVEDIRLIL